MTKISRRDFTSGGIEARGSEKKETIRIAFCIHSWPTVLFVGTSLFFKIRLSSEC